MAQENGDDESDIVSLPYTHSSRALSHLPAGRGPSADTLCVHCKSACWIATQQELRCHCRVLFTDVWTQARESVITACDGALLVDELPVEE